jgi:hypothetical protein
MNHGPGFWKYYRELKREVHALQQASYFGDGEVGFDIVPFSLLMSVTVRFLVFWTSTKGRYTAGENSGT